MAVFSFATAGAADLVEGKNYARLKVPQPVETGKKIEVIEFFSYGCPHCSDLEPYLQNWFKTAPADVQFRRVPVMFQERWKALAKIYYTLWTKSVFRPKYSRRSTPTAKRFGTTRRFSTGRPARDSIAPRSPAYTPPSASTAK
jgi:thiol-disulfide isomerase/thioredoxin